jgi:hypothetical protein
MKIISDWLLPFFKGLQIIMQINKLAAMQAFY